jgi:hypothetical protein
MKYFISSFFLILISQFSFSQNDLFFGFNSTSSGRNVACTFSRKGGNHEFGGGLRININRIAHQDDQNSTYKKRLYATEFIHAFGINCFYNRSFFPQWEHVHPYFFYDFQESYSTTRNRDFLPYDVDFNGEFLYKEHINIFGPFLWLEQNIGIGFKANLSNNIFIQQKLGMGACFIFGYDQKLLSKSFNWFEWQFSTLFTVGLGYRFD